MTQVVVVDSVRTGLAKAVRGTFNMTRSDELVSHCIDALLERNGAVDPAEIEDVILGAGRQIGEQSGNMARHSVALCLFLFQLQRSLARARPVSIRLPWQLPRLPAVAPM